MAVMFFTTSKGQATDPLDSLENTTFQIRQRPGTDGMPGYNYIAKDDDVWVYTGVTSATADSSIVGFVLHYTTNCTATLPITTYMTRLTIMKRYSA